MKIPKAITFDCYGTLIDWEGEVQQFFKKILEKYGMNLSHDELVELQRRWEDLQFDYIQEKYRPYREVLKNTLPITFREKRLPFSEEDCLSFSESMGCWKPFPDTREALLELKKYTNRQLN